MDRAISALTFAKLRIYLTLLAGRLIVFKKTYHQKTGFPFEFEILLVSPLFERIVLPFKKNLEKLGITALVRTVDSAQYQKRTQNFDFDMVVMTWGQSSSLGNEQRMFWSSSAADRPGSQNLSG